MLNVLEGAAIASAIEDLGHKFPTVHTKNLTVAREDVLQTRLLERVG